MDQSNIFDWLIFFFTLYMTKRSKNKICVKVNELEMCEI